nr:epimerase [Chitinophagaceae bacterium]
MQSRLESTGVLQQAMQLVEKRPRLWLNASSATIYADSKNHLNTENKGIIGSDFSMDVVKAWEAAFFQIAIAGVNQAALRISIVMGNGGGALPEYRAITKRLLGGHQGNGEQWISWIHHTDLCRALAHLMAQPNPQGIWNITAPQPIRNKAFMQVLRKNMGMPFGLPAPAALLKIAAALLGTETELLLK